MKTTSRKIKMPRAFDRETDCLIISTGAECADEEMLAAGWEWSDGMGCYYKGVDPTNESVTEEGR